MADYYSGPLPLALQRYTCTVLHVFEYVCSTVQLEAQQCLCVTIIPDLDLDLKRALPRLLAVGGAVVACSTTDRLGVAELIAVNGCTPL